VTSNDKRATECTLRCLIGPSARAPAPRVIGRGAECLPGGRSDWMAHSMYDRLSPEGERALAAGARWWRGLPLHRRLLVRLLE
jgi:hypothetical protein